MTPYEDLPKETTPDEMAHDFAIHLHTYGCNASEALAVLLGAAMNYIALHDALEEENSVTVSDGPSGYDLDEYADPISATIDSVYQDPKTWRDMTPEDKGVLLLAEHEGKVIEVWNVEGWWTDVVPYWFDDCAYRVRPEPVRETVTLYGEQSYPGYWGFDSGSEPGGYRITFDLVDGDPDCTSIRMERIDD